MILGRKPGSHSFEWEGSKKWGNKVIISPPSSSPPPDKQKASAKQLKADTPTDLAAHQSGGSLSKSQLGFPQVFSQTRKPPLLLRLGALHSYEAKGTIVRRSRASNFPLIFLSAALGKAAGERASLQRRGYRVPRKPQRGRRTNKDEPLSGQTQSASCRSGAERGLGLAEAGFGRGPARGAQPAGDPAVPAAPPRAGAPAPEPGVGTAPRSGPALGR